MIKIAINGFGRIGRAVLKVAVKRPELEVVAVNDLGDLNNLAYLLKYDSAYGKFDGDIKTEDGFLVVNGKRIRFVQEKDPAALPWKELGVDVAVESTGFFESYEKASLHLQAGAKKVVITAPAKGDPNLGKTVLMGVNEGEFATCSITSNGSCTTNAVSPIAQILSETIGIKKAILNTVHAYTATQKIVDSPDTKDWRRGRAGAHNIVPSSTGAAISVTEALPGLKGLFDGIAMRVPIITGSVVDFTFIAARETSVEEINAILKDAARQERWSKTFAITEEQLVSSDIIGSPYASIADLSFTKVVGGDLVKVLAWYDNEMGYTNALVEHIIKAGIQSESRI
ncbi:type I glyceraldehyde-3-phosphate dehydrogenase [Candidatus Azambacteria bacterium RIFCSPHIGHO2_02_FULL_52_12]|uniref:Type I glyceraldehyde-3-phosphate dehydrogenase n=1 Tax=Candidatus Azambacteria bacterium RIFCSPLOWO2_01_FULL_46_25 TaxID=1797298 RepID=A0A1F5BVY2_9BACT|nr:MAG: type I glyceraldehyde-3-phosphate dehydrogenase [Candidatus Azambacteria bacterium RIFCSPHIGHO2_02_FULL_52_12]OGD34767.1 MAG: type I glyceraldehyde-3-phosphate dehydrogenase [Candidatus Azambacteria bacterium RIFCSPLOWO2_01_FULL_46_25]OGD37892.1 MAG: type I glyceraldehyde-3-phosphate dehydrogenase [Candidatus Azambacteria bacterium RIFCSPHIGHO2_01_FULL_51_74]